jgi:hypothetical protein
MKDLLVMMPSFLSFRFTKETKILTEVLFGIARWIQGEKLSLNVKGNMYNFIHDPEAADNWGSRDLPDTEDIDVPARRQATKGSNIPP